MHWYSLDTVGHSEGLVTLDTVHFAGAVLAPGQDLDFVRIAAVHPEVVLLVYIGNSVVRNLTREDGGATTNVPSAIHGCLWTLTKINARAVVTATPRLKPRRLNGRSIVTSGGMVENRHLVTDHWIVPTIDEIVLAMMMNSAWLESKGLRS